jgi:phage terminase large subunit
MANVTSGAERWIADCKLRARGDSGYSEYDEERGRLKVVLGYQPFPKQDKFHKSKAKYRLFGGAAGPGKSKALLMETMFQALTHGGTNTLLLRRSFPEIEQSLLLYFRRDVPRELYHSFQESKHVVNWVNGSTTRFGYCQRESDVYQYQGAEFLFIGIDELTLFTLRQWQFLTSRNRCPVRGAFPCMAGATNPGNIGHAWVKALWINHEPAAGMESPEEYDPKDYEFIPARVSDNPIYAGDADYIKTLRALPSNLKRAFLDGDWDVFAGQYFDRFDWTRDVVRAEEIGWKPWWPRWISIDWGFEHPAAVYWHAQGEWENTEATQEGEEGPTGVPESARGADSSRAHRGVITYREYVTHRTPPRELAAEIVRRCIERQDGEPKPARWDAERQRWEESGAGREKIDAIYLSPDAFARRTDEASIAEQMGEVFAAAGLPRPVPADDDRVGGWMLMYQMLDADEWLLTENCVELIRTLPNLVRDSARVEDIEKMDGDDPADAARYGLKSRYGIGRGRQARMPLDQRLAARVVSEDPTIRAIQARKAQLEETRRVRPVSFVHRRRW